MTAREIMERMGEKAAMLGYITGRFQGEVLQPAIKRTFNIMFRAGRFPEVPEALRQVETDGGLDIEFMGFFAQIQKKYYATNGINVALEYSLQVAQIFGPEALDNCDPDQLYRDALDGCGTPQRAIREKADVTKIRDARAQAQAQAAQQQQQMFQAQNMMQNVDKLGKKPEDGSPLQQMDQANGVPGGQQ